MPRDCGELLHARIFPIKLKVSVYKRPIKVRVDSEMLEVLGVKVEMHHVSVL